MATSLKVATIEKARPRAARYEIPDSTPGLFLVVQPSGAKSWAFRFRSPTDFSNGQRKAKKLTLGTVALTPSNGEPQIGHPLTVGQARMLATRAMEDVRRNIDPTVVRREQKVEAKREAAKNDTIDAAMVEFLQRYKGKKRQGLRESTKLLTAHYLGLKPDPEKPGDWKKRTNGGVLKNWSGRPLPSITKRDVDALVEKISDDGHGVTANRTLTNLKTFFTWCTKKGLLAASPAELVDAPAAETTRDTILTEAELVAMWKAADADSYPFGRLAQLLLLTGARRDELREAPWSEFDLDAAIWHLPGKRAKNGRDHAVPLSPMALNILKDMPRIKGGNSLLFTTTGETPISGLSKAKDRIDKKMRKELGAIQPWTLHDLRRTLASGLQALCFSIEIVEAVLNHKSGTLRGVAGIYARHDYLAEKKQALDAWARHVDSLVNGREPANVVSIAARATT